MITLKYRPEIDGLRAIAVLSVVGFHFFPELFNSGFIGVDIFFVISGFLITGIILKNLEAKKFSYSEFYSRRIKRIFPALILVLLTSYFFGWHYLSNLALESDVNLGLPFEDLGKHISAGVLFVSNFLLWAETGYFDQIADSKPLLHLWSLAIEEQFYLIWPVLLNTLWKYKSRIFVFMSVITTISFALSILTLRSDPAVAFYSPLTRFWELLVGGILAYRMRNKSSLCSNLANGLATGGLLLVVASLFVVEKSNFPGWWVLLPILGSLMVIAAGSAAWINRNILNNRVLVRLGLISYPLYLWHWPMLFGLSRFSASSGPQASAKLALFIICLAVSELTYRFVEKPIRLSKNSKPTVFRLCTVMAIVGGLGYATYFFGFEGFHISEYQRAKIKELKKISRLKGAADIYGYHSCFIYDQTQTPDMFVKNHCFDLLYPDNPKVFVWGDSHSAALALGLKPYLKSKKINLIQISSGWCEPTFNMQEKGTNIFCDQINSLAFDKIGKIKPEIVLMDSYWTRAMSSEYFYGGEEAYFPFLLKTLERIKSLGAKKIVVVGQIPLWKHGLPTMIYENFVAKNKSIPERTYFGIQNQSLELDIRMRSLKYPKDVSYISLKEFLCDHSGCRTMVGPHLETDILVWDRHGHLTGSSAKYITEKLVGPALLDLL